MSDASPTGEGRSRRPVVSLFAHRDASNAASLVASLPGLAEDAGWRIVATGEEIEKFGSAGEGIEVVETSPTDAELCLVLGGDGTILRALRHHAGTRTAVFGVNYGTVGFLAAVEREGSERGIKGALAGGYETLDLPALALIYGTETYLAFNDVTLTRRPHARVAELYYGIAGEEVGHVSCDGLVVATPVGSTGYNLANNGPILAWGVAGYVVSYIAPHTLTARALVVAPDDILNVGNAAGSEAVEVAIDGVAIGELKGSEEAEVTFRPTAARLAQVPGTSFYHRIREKFGHLAV